MLSASLIVKSKGDNVICSNILRVLTATQRSLAVFAVITTILIIWICMWLFYKVMYPRPPKSMMPKEGDVTTPRTCNFCGHSLAEYRGVLETPPHSDAMLATDEVVADTATTKDQALFFCNYEHQADFHAGKTYNAHS